MKKIFKTQLNAAVIVLIPACIGINYLGKLFASFLKLPGQHRNLYRCSTWRTYHRSHMWCCKQPDLRIYHR